MGSPTYIPLATITLTGNDTTILFSNIPAIYDDLIVTASPRTDRSATNDPLRVRFNNDSGSNYGRMAMYGNGSSAAGYTDAPTEIIVDAGASGATASSGVFANFQMQVFDYADTNKLKSVLTTSDLATTETRRQSARWNSTATITSISIIPYFGTNFVSGSTFSLYGIAG